MRENRGPWYLLTGLMIGLVAGLIYAWVIDPVQYIDAFPNTLKPDAKDQYRVMIAMAYQADANLGRARQRLALLNDSNPAQALIAQAQRLGDSGSKEAKALVILAEAYSPRSTGQPSHTLVSTAVQSVRAPTGVQNPTLTLDPGQVVRTATLQPSATITITPTITLTSPGTLPPRPTLRPSPTLGAPFAFKDKQKVCDPNLPALLQIEVFNGANQPVSGIQIRATWSPNGSDIFYTGLAPDIGLGYADFQMIPKTIYGVQAGENGETVNGLSTQDCPQPDGSGTFQGGWKIRFAQP
jgi:hypothetical protein